MHEHYFHKASLLARMLPSIIGFIGGFFSAIFAEPLRHAIWGPKLKLEFGSGDEFLTPTPERQNGDEHKALFVRVKATNVRRMLAKSCRGYLIVIEKRMQDGDFLETSYSDSLQLAWSCKREDDQFGPLDLAKHVSQYIDVLSTRSTDARPRLASAPLPFRYDGLLAEPGTYRFTVQVAGEGVDPRTISFSLELDGTWNGIRAAAL